MLDEATPVALRSSDDSTLTELCDPSTRFSPLNCAAPTTELIWSRRATMSVWILPRSTFSAWAATILPFISVKSLVTDSAALRATVRVALPTDRLSEMPLKPCTSDSITLEIAQTAALSLAVATDLPVEISAWVLLRFMLIPFIV